MRLEAARAAYGVVQLVFPDRLGGLAGVRLRLRERQVVRVLGARHLLQAAASSRAGRGDLERLAHGAGGAVDLLQALSTLILSLASSRWRRSAGADGAVAASWSFAEFLIAYAAVRPPDAAAGHVYIVDDRACGTPASPPPVPTARTSATESSALKVLCRWAVCPTDPSAPLSSLVAEPEQVGLAGAVELAGGGGERTERTGHGLAPRRRHLVHNHLDPLASALHHALDQAAAGCGQVQPQEPPVIGVITAQQQPRDHQPLARARGVGRVDPKGLGNRPEVLRAVVGDHHQYPQLRERHRVLDLGHGPCHDRDQDSGGVHDGVDLRCGLVPGLLGDRHHTSMTPCLRPRKDCATRDIKPVTRVPAWTRAGRVTSAVWANRHPGGRGRTGSRRGRLPAARACPSRPRR